MVLSFFGRRRGLERDKGFGNVITLGCFEFESGALFRGSFVRGTGWSVAKFISDVGREQDDVMQMRERRRTWTTSVYAANRAV